eukprot:438068-Pelagomonas_calceolata.AAC.3
MGSFSIDEFVPSVSKWARLAYSAAQPCSVSGGALPLVSGWTAGGWSAASVIAWARLAYHVAFGQQAH